MSQGNIRIKRNFTIVGHSVNEVEFRTGVWNKFSHTISDDEKTGMLLKIIHQLDGAKSAKDIASDLNIPRSKVEGVIDYLQSLGILESTSSNAIDYYLDQFVYPFRGFAANCPAFKGIAYIGDQGMIDKISSTVQEAIPNVDVKKLTLDDPSLSFVTEQNDSWMKDGLKLEEKLGQADFLKGYFCVLCLDNVNPVAFKRFNFIAHHLHISWIHCSMDGPFLFIGPTFDSGNKGPCFDCFETLITLNLRESSSYLRYKNALAQGNVMPNDPPHNIKSVVQTLLASHASIEIINYFLTSCTVTLGKVLSIYLPSMEITFHEILKSSLCGTCSSIQFRDDTQLYFDFQKLVKEEVCS